MKKLTLALLLIYAASGLDAQQIFVAAELLRNAQYATVFTSTASGRIIDSRHFNELRPPAERLIVLDTHPGQDYQVTILLKGRVGFSSFTQTYAKTIRNYPTDTIADLDVPDFIPLKDIPQPLAGDGNNRFRFLLTGPQGAEESPSEIPLREFAVKNFIGNKHDFFGVDCRFTGLHKLGSLRNAEFKVFRFQSRKKEPNIFLIFDRREEVFRELFLPALVSSDSTLAVDFQELPLSSKPVYFDLKPFDVPWVKLAAKLTNGESVSLGTINGSCREDQLVQHPVVSRDVAVYHKFFRYFIDRTKDDFTTITRKESSPFLDDFNFSEIEYRPVDVILGNDYADLELLPDDHTGWEVFFRLPRTTRAEWSFSRSPAWYYRSGRGHLLPQNGEGNSAWSIVSYQPADRLVVLPDLPEGAAERFFKGRNFSEKMVVGAAFTAPLEYEQVTYAYWLTARDLY